MTRRPSMNTEDVRALAQVASLPLSADRVEALATLLGEWLPAADDLSRSMGAPEHRGIMPITVFAHTSTDATE